MSFDRTCRDYLNDILEHTIKARQFVEGVSFEAFSGNDEKVFAVIRAPFPVLSPAALGVRGPRHPPHAVAETLAAR